MRQLFIHIPIITMVNPAATCSSVCAFSHPLSANTPQEVVGSQRMCCGSEVEGLWEWSGYFLWDVRQMNNLLREVVWGSLQHPEEVWVKLKLRFAVWLAHKLGLHFKTLAAPLNHFGSAAAWHRFNGAEVLPHAGILMMNPLHISWLTVTQRREGE